jgi:hypothetical protein
MCDRVRARVICRLIVLCGTVFLRHDFEVRDRQSLFPSSLFFVSLSRVLHVLFAFVDCFVFRRLSKAVASSHAPRGHLSLRPTSRNLVEHMDKCKCPFHDTKCRCFLLYSSTSSLSQGNVQGQFTRKLRFGLESFCLSHI